jgi:hypothetical protein
MDHDDRCNLQDRELVALKEQFRQANHDLEMIVERVQRLVDQYHDQNVTLTRMDATLTTGVRDIEAIKVIVRDKVAGREEFLTVRNQFWTGIGVVALGILTAFTTWLVRGGLMGGVK